MERRINPITKRVEVKLQPAGLPEIWVDEGFCERCEQFGECLGLAELTDVEWQSALNLIKQANSMDVAVLKITNELKTKLCAEPYCGK